MSHQPRDKGASFPAEQLGTAYVQIHLQSAADTPVRLGPLAEVSLLFPVTGKVGSVTRSSWEPGNMAPGGWG